MQKVTIVLVLLAACSTSDIAPQPQDLSSVAEQYCKDHPALPCGHVYECTGTTAMNQLGFEEVCVVQFGDYADLTLAEQMYGGCVPTPRHEGLCWWCCGPGCTSGCNAYNGCFCPNTGSGSGSAL